MADPHFFGYGSLVNRATHQYADTRPARLSGWRRLWRHTALREVAFLTIAEAEGHSIDGLIAAVPDGNWAALDLREAAYDRLPVTPEHIQHDHPDTIAVAVYKTRLGNDAPPSTRHPILQSYLDTVVQGYLNVFGHDGATRFFETTDGWDSPVLDDRKAPVYPRAAVLTPAEKRLVDAALDDLAVPRLRP